MLYTCIIRYLFLNIYAHVNTFQCFVCLFLLNFTFSFINFNFQIYYQFTPVHYPCKVMSSRFGPLPSYDDIISGNFLKQSETRKNENKKDGENKENKSFNKTTPQHSAGFKYVEDTEDGEISEPTGPVKLNTKKRQAPNNTNNNNKINNKQSKKDKEPNYTSNTTSTSNTSNTKNAKNVSSASSASTPFVPRLVCRYFMEGICSKGDKCTFSHSVVPNKTPEEARVKEPCKFFIMGSCMKGDACYFSHDLSVVPCKFFHLRGECSAAARGSSCRFSHAPIDKETLEKLRAAELERIKSETSSDTPTALSSTPQETSQTHKETEKTTECPHDYLNPFAFSGSDNEGEGDF